MFVLLMYVCVVKRHKGIVVLPQMLLAQTPPIPFHTLKQCEGDYVVTCPSAFHFVLNGGANFAEAMNYPSEEWTYYSYPFTRCTCAHKAGYTAIERLFKLPKKVSKKPKKVSWFLVTR
jgi:hypothetical protein